MIPQKAKKIACEAFNEILAETVDVAIEQEDLRRKAVERRDAVAEEEHRISLESALRRIDSLLSIESKLKCGE